MTNDNNDNESSTMERALWYIADLHKMAWSVGEDVTNFGMLLYPLLDFS